MLAVIGDHLVAAFHGADRRLQHGATGIAEALAGLEIGLFSHHAFAAYFLHLAVGVGDDPVPREQARGYAAFIADGDGVRKNVASLFRIGLILEIAGVHVDANLVLGLLHCALMIPNYQARLA